MIHPSGLPGKPSRLLQDGSRMPYTPPPPTVIPTMGHTVGGGSSPGGAYARAYLPQRPNDADALGSGYTSLALSWGGGEGLLHPAVGTGGSSCRVQPTPGIWLVGLTGAFFVSMHTGSCTTHDAYVDMLNIFGSAYSRTRSEHAAPQCPSGDTRSLAMRTCATELKNTYM